jgi:glutamate dehydrogenase (NADP+)
MIDAPKFAAMAGPRFMRALERSPLSADILARLAEPQRVVQTRLPVRTDAGPVRMLQSWRVQYCDALGPMKGGVRFHEGVNEAELTSLAFRILLKCAVNRLPHGGAAGGVAVDTRGLSRRELEAVSRAYVAAYADVVGPDRDILSPDLYTDATVMAWMSDEYNRVSRALLPAAINGKAPGRGGVPGRHMATAKGAATVLAEVLAASGRSVAGLTVAIQGFGAAGSTVALELQARGAKIVAVSDSTMTLHDARGLDVAPLVRARAERKRLSSSVPDGAETRASGALLEVPVDVLVPAARGNLIDAGNAPRVRASYLLEIANGPVAAEAEEVLAKSGTTIIPDLLANAGGITVSHFEWIQGKSGQPTTEDAVLHQLEARMTATTRAILAIANRHEVPLAVAAQLSALLSLQNALVA